MNNLTRRVILGTVILALGWVFVTPATAAWYNSSWGFRKPVVISSSMVSGGADLTNFPVLVSVTDAQLKSTANGGNVGKSDGTDILFTSSDGTTKLSHEIEKYTATTGELVAWVKVPTLSYTANTTLYIYYGNASATNQQDAANVWDSNYKAVWHHGAGTGSTSGDSTSNVNNGTLTSTTWTTSGKIGNALAFDGTNSKSNPGTPLSLNMTTAVTVSGWMNTSTTSGTRRVFLHGGVIGNPWEEYTMVQVDAKMRWSLNTGDNLTYYDSVANLSISTWYYWVGTWDGTTMRLFFNGSQDSSTSKSGTITDHNNQSDVGFDSMQNYYWSGTLDEIRISNIARSAGWITTEYNNQNSPSTYVVPGTQESSDTSGAFFEFF